MVGSVAHEGDRGERGKAKSIGTARTTSGAGSETGCRIVQYGELFRTETIFGRTGAVSSESAAACGVDEQTEAGHLARVLRLCDQVMVGLEEAPVVRFAHADRAKLNGFQRRGCNDNRRRSKTKRARPPSDVVRPLAPLAGRGPG